MKRSGGLCGGSLCEACLPLLLSPSWLCPHPARESCLHPALQVDAGCEKDLVFGDPTAPRFVWWEGKLRPTPSGPDALTFDLLTILGKLRAGLGAVGLFKGPMPGEGRQGGGCERAVDRWGGQRMAGGGRGWLGWGRRRAAERC